jgi:hypothetical protein
MSCSRHTRLQAKTAWPTSARFLYYELVVRAVLQKHKEQGKRGRRSDQDLHDALTYLRQKGFVPWEWLVDETRSLDDFTGWSSINAWATTSVKCVRLDPWQGRAPLLLLESRSLAGVLRRLAQHYAIKIAATNGQVGGFLHTDVAPMLKPDDRVLYGGDWDWQGHQIEDNTRRVLERKIGGELQPLQIMKPDRRYSPVQYHPAIETEALQQQVIVQIVRDALDTELPEPLENARSGSDESWPVCWIKMGGANDQERNEDVRPDQCSRRHRRASDRVRTARVVDIRRLAGRTRYRRSVSRAHRRRGNTAQRHAFAGEAVRRHGHGGLCAGASSRR